MNRAEAFRQAVEIGSWQHRRITISLGVASKDRNKTTKAERLIAMADEALYVSKTNGRNRVSLGTTYKAAA